MNKIYLIVSLILCQQFVSAQDNLAVNIYASPNFELQNKQFKTGLKSALEQIEKKFHIFFNYDPDVIKDKSIQGDFEPSDGLAETLDELLRPLNLRYKDLGNSYYAIVRENEEPTLKKTGKSGLTVPETPINPENRIQRNIGVVLPLIPDRSNLSKWMEKTARSVTGRVVDQAGDPLIGVNIQVKGANTGTATDFEGNFTLEDIDENAVLVVSYVGYQTMEVSVAGKSILNITMVSDSQLLDEVVVVGYGAQKKATLTGSISSTEGKILTRSPAISVTNSLSGVLPGLISLNRSGEPGADAAQLLIRGQSTTGDNSPLVVVDGIQNPEGWERLNQNDIEQITVLKDASAAIYGARTANGVILITTKRGKIGKPTLNYSFNQGISKPTRLPELANSALYAEFVNDEFTKQGLDPRYSKEEIEKFRNGTDPNYPNIDWFDEVLKDVSFQGMHNLNVRGGNEAVQYSISGSYSNQNSIFKKGIHEYDGFTLRSNVDAKISENLNVSLDINSGWDNRVRPGTENPWGWFYVVPMMPVYFENGLPSAGIEQGLNPAVMATKASGEHKTKSKRYNTKIGFDYNLPWISSLSVDGYFVYKSNEVNDRNWRTPWTVYNYDQANNEYLPLRGGRITSPQLNQSNFNNNESFINLRIKYENQFKDHYFNSFVGVEQTIGSNNNFEAFRRDFVSTIVPELFAGDPGSQQNDGLSSEYARQSILGRLSYNYKEKYLIDFNARLDGSHIFPKGKRFGFFPGVSVAWKLNEENMFRDIEIVDDFKLRASYGQIGNDNIAPYQFLSSYILGLNQGYHFGLPTLSTLGATPGVAPNPDITWEVSTIKNLGVDGVFWDNTILFSIDLFNQRRENILTTRSLEIPAYTALNLPAENIGIVENKGVELSITHRNKLSSNKKFNYLFSANVAYAKNKVIDVSEAQDVPDYQKAEGRILGAGLYYKAKGIFRSEEDVKSEPVYPGTQVGDLQYTDVNNDGIIDAADRVRLDKSNIPQITFGINVSFDYSNFSLYTNFAGQSDAWQYIHQDAAVGGNALKDLLENRYTKGSSDSKYPIIPSTSSIGGQPSGLQSDFWLQNTAFLRLKTLEFGYEVPKKILEGLNLNSLRLYINGNNLITFSEMKWFDPEGDSIRGSFYPQNKIFNFGINITL